MLQDKLESLRQEALEAFQKAADSRALYETKVKFLGKQGQLSQVMKDLGKVSKEERPAFGKIVNEIKVALESTYEVREAELKQAELEVRMRSERIDLSLPGPELPVGAVHPIPLVINEIVEILSRIGFSVRTGPVIEKDRYNFEALNIPPDHPARDMQDTFYIDQEHVLRTQTSPIQIRTMENEKPPIRIIAPGGVFRVDSDASHAPNFHQIECLVVDEKVSMADLRGTIAFFVKEFFGPGIATRFRPSFFPFTEPSAEMDCQCPVCKGKGCRLCSDSGWIEIGGCGLVHPNVFRASGVAYPRWQGFAFGFGIERMAMVKYGVNDIRLFNENDRRFLEQFRI